MKSKAKPLPVIHTDEWLAELEKLTTPAKGDPTFLSTRDLMERTGLTLCDIRRRLARAHRLGLLHVQEQNRPSITGRLMHVPCYRVGK